MKSKEAVLFNCEIGKNLRDNEDFKEQVAYPAMNEYAKIVAIAFAEWINNNDYHPYLFNDWLDDNGEPVTSGELFNKFLTEHKTEQ